MHFSTSPNITQSKYLALVHVCYRSADCFIQRISAIIAYRYSLQLLQKCKASNDISGKLLASQQQHVLQIYRLHYREVIFYSGLSFPKGVKLQMIYPANCQLHSSSMLQIYRLFYKESICYYSLSFQKSVKLQKIYPANCQQHVCYRSAHSFIQRISAILA